MPIVEKVKKNSEVYDIQDSRISDISSFVTLNGAQTLNNKTLLNPVIQSGSGTNDKITVEGKINSSNGITLNADVKINKSIQIDPSEEGEFFVGISNTSANSHTNVNVNGITTFHPYQGWEMFTGINVDQGPHIRLTKNGIDKRLLIPNVDGTLATVGDVNTLASTVSSNYSNTVKKNDSGLQYITGSLSVAGGITSPNYKTASIVFGNTYGQIISGGMDHIDYSDNYYKPYLRFTTEGTFARGVVNPNISLGTYISNYNVYSFIRGLSPNQNSGEADYVEYKLPQVDSNEVTETTLLCTHDLQDSFYAPTTPGTTSQVLMGNPSGEPQWKTVAQALSSTKAKIYKYELIVDYMQYNYSNLIVYTTMDLDTSSLLSQFNSNYSNLYYFLAGTAPATYGEKIGPAYIESNQNGLLPILYVKRGSSSQRTVSPYAFFGSTIAADDYPVNSIASISKSIVNLDLK